MLVAKDLEFAYNERNSFRFPDINCRQGEHWLISGPSGCGKTTFLHLLAGLLRPGSGSIHINDTDIVQLKKSALDTFRGRNIGIVFQRSFFIRSLSVRKNILLAQYMAGAKQDRAKADSILESLNIIDKATEKPDNLSQGEQQRLSIARSIINDPGVILADEPTSSLDDNNCEEMISLIEGWAREQGASLLIVTHDQRMKDRFKNQIIL